MTEPLIEQALVLLNQGELNGAKSLLQKHIEINPGDSHGWLVLGALSGQAGEFQECIDYCIKALVCNPSNSDAQFNLAQAYMMVGDFESAIIKFRQIITQFPQHITALNNLGVALFRTKRLDEAEKCHRMAILVDESAVDSYFYLVDILLLSGGQKEAETYLDKILEIDPVNIDALKQLGGISLRNGRSSSALKHYLKAQKHAPEDSEVLINIALSHLSSCEYEEANQYFLKALTFHPDNYQAQSAYLFSLNYIAKDSRFVFNEHVRLLSSHKIALFNNVDRESDSKINLAYISSDFRNHSVAHFIKPILRRHHKSKFKVFCYALIKKEDKVSEEIKLLCDRWIRIDGVSAEDTAQKIKNDNIDILVDLSGHTVADILPVLECQPAPVQITYLGYPNTTGSNAVQYRITDEITDPSGIADGLYSEKLIRLQEGFLCYEPPDDMPQVKLRDNTKSFFPITFGSFNNYIKMTDDVISLWARILKNTSGSGIVLKSRYFHDPNTCEKLYARFSEYGVPREQIRLFGNIPDRSEHLELYNRIDIALDTFPYNGTTTTFESLWMGVPVITLKGCVHAGRVGASILKLTRVEELIANDEDGYCEVACKLANDGNRLKQYKTSLRKMLAASPLLDGSSFISKLERAYIDVWNRRSCT